MTTHKIALVAPVDGLTSFSLVAADGDKKLESVILGDGLSYDSGGALSILASEIDHDLLLNVHQDVNTDASPTFAKLTITSSVNEVYFNTGTGEIPLSIIANNVNPTDIVNPFICTGGGGSLQINSSHQVGSYGPLFLNPAKTGHIIIGGGGGNVAIGYGINEMPAQKLSLTNSYFSYVYYYNGSTYTSRTAEARTSGGTPFTVLADTDDFLYLGMYICGSVYFGLNTVGAGITLKLEYWNGSAWTNLAITDGTSNLTQSGLVTFSIPSDWSRNEGVPGLNGYWIRFSTTTNPDIPPTANFVTKSYVDLVSIRRNFGDAVCFTITKEGVTQITDLFATAATIGALAGVLKGTAGVLSGAAAHADLASIDSNQHIDHTAVSIIAGTGMSGGGTIAANRTLNCDITQYTDALARTACIAASIADGDLTHAPDGNSVFDALALKATIASPTFTGMVTLPASTLIPDGGTIGQATGPLMTFQDTNNHLEITGCQIGIGAAVDSKAYFHGQVEVGGTFSHNQHIVGLLFAPTIESISAGYLTAGIGIMPTFGTGSINLQDCMGLYFGGFTKGTSGTLANIEIIFMDTMTAACTNAYGLYMTSPTGGVSNYGIYQIGSAYNVFSGRCGLGGVIAPAAQIHVDQSSTTGAIPVLTLDQGDISEEFIRFIGTAADDVITQSIVAAADVGVATIAGYIRIYVQDDGNQITDQAYYVPIYTLAAP